MGILIYVPSNFLSNLHDIYDCMVFELNEFFQSHMITVQYLRDFDWLCVRD
jgi:hypothetical protein